MVVIACFMKIAYVWWLADKAIPDLVEKVMASSVWFCIGIVYIFLYKTNMEKYDFCNFMLFMF